MSHNGHGNVGWNTYETSSDESTYSSASSYSYASSGSAAVSCLSTESTYGSYGGTWTGKDTNGYDADVESNASTS